MSDVLKAGDEVTLNPGIEFGMILWRDAEGEVHTVSISGDGELPDDAKLYRLVSELHDGMHMSLLTGAMFRALKALPQSPIVMP